MINQIEHQGIVQAIANGYAEVKIEQKSACAGCHARGACSAADLAEKVIEVPLAGKKVAVGDVVTIIGADSMGRKAVRLAFIYPFLALFAVLAITYQLSHNELLAGILALAVLLPYYVVLYLLRNKLKDTFVFTIEIPE